MNIAILCTHKNSHYSEFANTECFDRSRDCRTFVGNEPVIAHPPCRGWTRFGKAMGAKPRPGEKDLAYFCLERVITNGGVLEHPFESEFAIEAEKLEGLKTVVVDQEWWGMWCRKRTRLLMPKHYLVPEFPFDLIGHVGKEKTYREWANKDASITPLEFCKWLIELVRINNEI